MKFTQLGVFGTIEDYRVAVFTGTLVIMRFSAVNDVERKVYIAAAKLCPGVYVDGDTIYASVNVNGYDALVMKQRALMNTFKDYVRQARDHLETHKALGV